MNSSLSFNIPKRNMSMDLFFFSGSKVFSFLSFWEPRAEKFPLIQIIHQYKNTHAKMNVSRHRINSD